ncbi:nicotinate-nucleotide--dimethylbenzimidazole phosphoribosyltransferase [Natronoglycomyces albus]|uniref:Nicotinate-nucleotide--dimethylbenzimidazole phosphoribosyltransferase n=1 Tax=Natronoglycomyces albus TaxID=2811108 RepID=A0A895XRN0_9ACTN|nr:nicotinate-nucleotide--dimethylbenzimidazole phosphoribosyltransferase [Natronoglycomyces albus]QSB06362.1 nicotinate-nucleotide--dimethylbenzimidazole phosphoribosyltransferase [Natronoglycomyces albus]
MSESTAAGPMTDLKAKFPNAVWTTRALNRLARAQIPGSGLGGLAASVGWAARVQGTASPVPFSAPRLIQFCGAYPPGWDAGELIAVPELIASTRKGESLLASTAAQAQVPVEIVEVPGHEFVAPGLLDTASLHSAQSLGRQSADRAIDQGADILLIGTFGAGAATAAAAVTSFTTRMDITELVAPMFNREGLIDDASWMRRVAALRDHMAHNRGFKRKADDVSARLGGAALSAAAAAIVSAAVRSVPVLLDGPGAMAAMMIAREYTLAAPKWCYSPDRSPHPVVERLAKQTGMAAGAGLGVDIADGISNVLGWQLMQRAVELAASLPIPEDGESDDSVEKETEEDTEEDTELPLELQPNVDPNLLED